MKKTVLFITSIVASTIASSHLLLTDTAIESAERFARDGFFGFEFTKNANLVDQEFFLSGDDIEKMNRRLNRNRALLHYSLSPPSRSTQQNNTQNQSGNNNSGNNNSGNNNNSVNNNSDWFEYADAEVTTHILYPDTGTETGGGNHDDGIFFPGFRKANNAAIEFCSNIEAANPELYSHLIPYFTGPSNLITFVYNTDYGIDVPSLLIHSLSSSAVDSYQTSDGIFFKCAYLSD